MNPPQAPPTLEPADVVPQDNKEYKSDKRKGKRRMHEDWAVASDSQLAVAAAPKARKMDKSQKLQGKVDGSNSTMPQRREWNFKNSNQVTYRASRARGRTKLPKTSSSSRKTSVACDFGFGGLGAAIAADAASSNVGAR